MLRLKEKPTEWIRFTAVMAVSINLIFWFGWWQAGWPVVLGLGSAFLGFLVVIMAIRRPIWFRPFYRHGMRLSYQIGQLFGMLLLFILFFLLVTPMGLLLRLLGKDLLGLKPDPEADSFWKPSRTNRNFDKMY